MLEAAAVCGVGFRVHTVAAVLGQDPAAVAAICDDIAHRQSWLTAPARDASHAPIVPYVFRHARCREALYERIGPLARRQLYRKEGVAADDVEARREVPGAKADTADRGAIGLDVVIRIEVGKLEAELARSLDRARDPGDGAVTVRRDIGAAERKRGCSAYLKPTKE